MEVVDDLLASILSLAPIKISSVLVASILSAFMQVEDNDGSIFVDNEFFWILSGSSSAGEPT